MGGPTAERRERSGQQRRYREARDAEAIRSDNESPPSLGAARGDPSDGRLPENRFFYRLVRRQSYTVTPLHRRLQVDSLLRIASLNVLMLLGFVSTAGAQTPSPDEVVDVFARAWNAHNMKAFGDVLSDDADWVTVAGARLKGRTEIQAFLDKEHNGWARTTSMSTKGVAIRVLGADAAAVHFNWEITGAISRDGQPAAPSRGVNLFVVAKQGTGWRVVAGQVAIERRMP